MKNTLLILVLLLGACSSPVNQNSSAVSKSDRDRAENAIDNGVGTLNTPEAESFVIDMKGAEIITRKHTRIKIPANAFETLDGKNPGQKARITFAEYQTTGEIIASKLPMTYTDPNGKTINFESAGMFEIRAYAGKEELKLREGKEIEVELASPTDGMFNFYQLNDNTRAWKEEATNLRPIRNPYLQEISDSIQKLQEAAGEKPKKPVQSKEGDRLIDIKLNVSKYPDFAELGPVMWKYMGTDEKSNPANNPKLFHTSYKFVSLSPSASSELVFNVQFASEKDTVQLPLAPVYTGKLKARGEKYFEEKLKKFTENLQAREALRKQDRAESALLRVMKLDKLGIYNYDRQLKDYNVPVLASFTFGDQKHTDKPNMNVYLIPKGKAALIKYDLATAEKFAINPSEENVLIAVDENNVVYALSDAEIRKLNLPRYKNKKLEIKLHKKEKKCNTAAEMDQLIAVL